MYHECMDDISVFLSAHKAKAERESLENKQRDSGGTSKHT